jgi:hypothetical protein
VDTKKNLRCFTKVIARAICITYPATHIILLLKNKLLKKLTSLNILTNTPIGLIGAGVRAIFKGFGVLAYFHILSKNPIKNIVIAT